MFDRAVSDSQGRSNEAIIDERIVPLAELRCNLLG